MKTKDWIIAGNWKMNLDRSQALTLVDGIIEKKDEIPDEVDLILAPSFPFIEIAVEKCRGSDVLIAAQNCHSAEPGAFTGEVGVEMLSSFGVNACIAGHSERRGIFKESDEAIAKKTDALLHAGLLPIWCCGEGLDKREGNEHFAFVEAQLQNGLFHLSEDEMHKVVIAYEPIWAIGTGKTASPDQAQEMHAHIRKLITGKYGEEIGEDARIIYGGSCNAANAVELFSCPDVNGGLIGGSALDAGSFLSIAQAPFKG